MITANDHTVPGTRRRPLHGALALSALLLVACTTPPRGTDPRARGPAFDGNAADRAAFFEPVREPRHAAATAAPDATTPAQQTRILATPTVTVRETVTGLDRDDSVPPLSGPALAVNYHDVPLPAFINQVFGEQLGLSFTLQPELQRQADLVTLRITEPVAPADLFRIARTTLASYGVAIGRENGLLLFLLDKSSKGGQTPLLVSGRTLPEVPDNQRPIFMFVPLEVVANAKVKGWLGNVMSGVDLTVQEDPVRNAIVLMGKPREVEQALAIVKSLDQPLMRGKFSMNVQPAYVPVKELANDLERILQSEGIDASQRPPQGSVIVLPLESSNALVVFAPSQETLAHVREWIDTLDRERQLGIEDGIFSYEAINTKAEGIVEMLNSLDGGAARGTPRVARPLRVQPSDAASVGTEAEGRARSGLGTRSTRPASATARNSGSSAGSGGRFVVDFNRNAVLFRGAGREWLDLLPTVRSMDKPTPSVMVEVLIAEVTLNDEEATGVEWLGKSAFAWGGKRFEAGFGTLNGLGIGSQGFNFTLDNAGETRAAINLFYENKRAEIRSRPRLMVMSGQSARIDVGDEIPLVSSSSRSLDNPDAPVVNNVEYRRTGVKLEITPTVHASGYVDIEVSQELSQAQKNSTSGIDSPTIFNRSIETTVTLKDGGSILLGGLVSSTGGDTARGMPVLGKMPLVGKLFRSDGETQDRTELMVMIIPYVVRSPEEAEELAKKLAPPN